MYAQANPKARTDIYMKNISFYLLTRVFIGTQKFLLRPPIKVSRYDPRKTCI